jgi:hypothetical protein
MRLVASLVDRRSKNFARLFWVSGSQKEVNGVYYSTRAILRAFEQFGHGLMHVVITVLLFNVDLQVIIIEGARLQG